MIDYYLAHYAVSYILLLLPLPYVKVLQVPQSMYLPN
jgi:hypothetical protein